MFRVSFFLVAAVSVAACSLVVSTDGLAGDPITSTTDAEAGPTESGAADAASDGDGGGELEPAGCPDLHGLSTTSPWPMVGGCPSQPGRSGVVGPANATKVRSFAQAPAGASFASGVIAADGTVYIGVEDVKGVCAYNPDGTVKWCGSQDNSDAVALSSEGAVLWQKNLSSAIVGQPLLDGNARLYVLTSEPAIHALASFDGSELWSDGLAAQANGAMALTAAGALIVVQRTATIRAYER